MTTRACKHCGTPIPAENITDGELAVCDNCSTLNNLSSEPLSMPQKNKSKNIKLTYREVADGIEISYQWRKDNFANKVFFLASLIGVLVSITVLISFLNNIPTLFCMAFSFFTSFIVVILFAIFTFQKKINGIVLHIGEQSIQTRMLPSPMLDYPNRQVDRQAIEQIFVTARVVQFGNKHHYMYDVYIVETGNLESVLVPGIPEPEEALFIEQTIERHYEIEDVPIAGEWEKASEKRKQSGDSE